MKQGPFRVGQLFSHYRILQHLGEGGMGTVYKALDAHLDRFVAIKVLLPERAGDPGRNRRFVLEAKAASGLNHPNIVTIYDADQREGVDFIAMEYIAGATIENVVPRRGMPLGTALRYAIQIADALAAAHAAGIVHRDLKPANVMVMADGRVKILDFGLAKPLGMTPSAGEGATAETLSEELTGEGRIVGTVSYMSPEQAQGKRVDSRSDIFSFGSILYEMVTGKRAFQGDSNVATLAAVLKDAPRPAGEIARGLPRELERLIGRCLRKDPNHRFQHMDDLKVLLEEIKEDSDSGTYDAAPATRGKRGRLWAVATILALAMVAASVFVWRERWIELGTSGGEPIRSVAVLPFAKIAGDAGTDYLCESLTESLISRLSGIPKPELLVKSMLSVEPYRNDQRDFRRIGAALGVDAVLTGRVEDRGSSKFISVELTDVRNGMHRWGRRFERTDADVSDIQSSIGDEVTESLRLRLSAEDQRHLKVYQLYQNAQYYWERRTESDLKRAIALFSQAIAEDPQYAPAHAGLANCYVLQQYYGGVPARDSYPKAEKAAEEALALDPSLADAHSTLALIRRDYDFDWNGAETEFRRTIELNPRLAVARQWYAEYLTSVRRFSEALTEIRKAEELSPSSLATRAVHGWILLCAGRTTPAIEQLEETVDKRPDYPLTRWFLGQAYARSGSLDRATSELERACKLSPGASRMLADLGCVYGMSGKRSQAREIVRQLRELSGRRAGVSEYEFAVVYAGLGDLRSAFEALERAHTERTWQLANVGVDPMLEPLRADPRYAAMVRRLGLPPS